MPYLPSLNSYLHQSSLLIQAYPDTRISTKYSLPSKKARSKAAPATATAPATADGDPASEKRTPAATLTLKTYHPPSGICLKYQTDKAAEVGRLVTGLGKLAKGELIEMPVAASAAAGTKMDVDGAEEMQMQTPEQAPAKVVEEAKTQSAGANSGAGGKGKKKKGKK